MKTLSILFLSCSLALAAPKAMTPAESFLRQSEEAHNQAESAREEVVEMVSAYDSEKDSVKRLAILKKITGALLFEANQRRKALFLLFASLQAKSEELKA